MGRNTGNKPTTPHNSGSTFLTGILIGMVIGAGMAAGLAWFVMKSPSPFVQKESANKKLATPTEDAKPNTQTPEASGVTSGKPRFEFYKVLTDKEIAATAKPAGKQQPAKPQAIESRPLAANTSYFLQAGSFSKADDAEKLKARLALLGLEANIQTATIPDKGVWHRVRLGPYTNIDEMSGTRNLLKQNGVNATPMRVQ